jgi:hypothetical protein
MRKWFGNRHIAGEIADHPGLPARSNPGGVGVSIADKRSLLWTKNA